MRYVTGGESHGPALTAIVEGVPAGLKISEKQINIDLERRQSGYGRGGRQTIEKDTVRVLSGIRFGKTIGSPVTLLVENKDWENWEERMAAFGKPPADLKREITPRPGHADLVGVLKNNTDDCRDILERASARETAARVAAAGIAREFLADLGVNLFSYVVSIGSVALKEDDPILAAPDYKPLDIELSDLRCPDEKTSEEMKKEISKARKAGDTLGGTFRVVATGLLPGLGSYADHNRRLTSQIGGAIFSIPAIKGLEFGLGFEATRRRGSKVHDAITHTKKDGFMRGSNNAGGLEGGMTTGMPLIVTAGMKPISTLMKPLDTINIDTLEPEKAWRERSDVCAVPAAAVVAEAELAFVLANAYLEKFGGDNMTDIKASIKAYKQRIRTMSR
ncbi:MAG: chorismate synthase [Eggerthellaceae bacterium]|jgi:chorismate synthase